jgi:hypothetical protein
MKRRKVMFIDNLFREHPRGTATQSSDIKLVTHFGYLSTLSYVAAVYLLPGCNFSDSKCARRRMSAGRRRPFKICVPTWEQRQNPVWSQNVGMADCMGAEVVQIVFQHIHRGCRHIAFRKTHTLELIFWGMASRTRLERLVPG